MDVRKLITDLATLEKIFGFLPVTGPVAVGEAIREIKPLKEDGEVAVKGDTAIEFRLVGYPVDPIAPDANDASAALATKAAPVKKTRKRKK
ncbi:hypothetical protein [uncultured Roseibium sp.]|uniref:hypothetical protein n=1 Tax=uncultured Roseibium sp. TaxID=1936171 RepID=UPI0026254263|nr:hypothetical protein [uncultured Roseibium sp.]